jgi:type I restriction enzyme M protein
MTHLQLKPTPSLAESHSAEPVRQALRTQATRDIVAALWSLCNVLKDDGVTYHQYVTELTYLLFLKMAKETATDAALPTRFRWDRLAATPAGERLDVYRRTLTYLGTRGHGLIRAIFENSSSFIKKPSTLSTLVAEIDRLAWYSARREGLGDLYEGLLEKNATEKKSGAGQYFTPRPLVDAMVAVMRPSLDDIIQDPAAGTGGFLIAASQYIREHESHRRWTASREAKFRKATFYGMEHVQDTHRLALMNLMLHELDSEPAGAGIRYGDTLSADGQRLPHATLILTNPPFGNKRGGGIPSRTDFTFSTSNKQLCFLQHVYRGLARGGRAAVVVPDNVLFESNAGLHVRRELMNLCNVHTVLRLPTGIFYAQGVKTNVLFFTRGRTDKNNTKEVWIYDLRAGMAPFGRRTPLTRDHFREFEHEFGSDPLGQVESLKQRRDGGGSARFRRFSRAYIAERGDNLDISWLRGGLQVGEPESDDPGSLARTAIGELEAAMAELRAALRELEDGAVP